MNRSRIVALLSVLVLSSAACSVLGLNGGSSASKKSEGTVAARIGDREILVSEVDASLESELRKLELQRYQARKGRLDQMIEQAILEAEADERGITVQELLEKEVLSRVAEPTDEEVRAYYDRYADRIPQSFEEIEGRLREGLRSQRVGQAQQELLSSLRADTDVAIALEPPRVAVPTDSGVSHGPANAPITLVEFSDFQCPYCARSQATVDQVLDHYGDKIRHVFVDFPLESIHPQARAASIAARCAGEQDKYWEFHETLFENQGQIAEEPFQAWAKDLELDTDAFAACMDSGRHDAAVTAGIAAGRQAGVSGTPAFFVNGVMINGAQPFPAFQSLIESELANAD